MIGKAKTVAPIGVTASEVQVEVDIRNGLPSFEIVGLADKAVSESKQRVASAIKNSGYYFPTKKIIVNLAPANLPKFGAHYDLAIAISILAASKQVLIDTEGKIFAGELSLDGSLRSIQSALIIASYAKKQKLDLFISDINKEESSYIKELNIYPFKNLKEVIQHLQGTIILPKMESKQIKNQEDQIFDFDISMIKGQEIGKRGVIIACAGGHNILMIGSPGTGKTLLAKSIPSILPSLSYDESIEVSTVYSSAGLLSAKQPIIKFRPFRNPHHTASIISITGGGNNLKPGEVSLAHRGVLFLDEFTEFPSSLLEALRQPLEEKEIKINRINGTVTYPASFMLVAAMNPCKCGYFLDDKKECKCSAYDILRYRKRISGPVLDRFDLSIYVKRTEFSKIIEPSEFSSYEEIKKAVINAKDIQEERYKGKGIYTNSEMSIKDIDKYIVLNNSMNKLLSTANEKYNFSARSIHKILKVARTIADLKLKEKVEEDDLLEALNFRIEKVIL